MDLYQEKVGEDQVKHLGKKRECVIVDITDEGDIELRPDDELVEEYGLGTKEDNEHDKKISVGIITSLDKKPMGG